MAEKLENISTKKLRQRKKWSVIFVWLFLAVILTNFTVLLVKHGINIFADSELNMVPMVYIPGFFLLFFSFALKKMNEELEKRKE